MNKKGFTLAEVLITLGIIGVVAALTLPPVISHHNKKVVETRLAKFYSVMNQAIQRSIADNGDMEYWITDPDVLEEGRYINDTKLFDKYIIPYLDAETYYNYEVGGYANNRKVYVLKDGSAFNSEITHMTFSFTPDILVDSLSNGDVELKYMGKKLFHFVIPKCSNNTAYHNSAKDIIGIVPTSNIYELKKQNREDEADTWDCNEDRKGKVNCAAVIMRNGWKIPDDYPIKF